MQKAINGIEAWSIHWRICGPQADGEITQHAEDASGRGSKWAEAQTCDNPMMCVESCKQGGIPQA